MAETQPVRTVRPLGPWIALAVFAAIAVLDGLGHLQGTENILLGLRFQMRGPREPSDTVVIVTLETPVAGAEATHPWPKRELTQTVKRLDAAGAAVIGLDLPGLAGEPELPDAEEDNAALAEAMRAHGGVVLPLVIKQEPASPQPPSETVARFSCGEGKLRRPISLEPGSLAAPTQTLAQAAAGLGATNVYPDSDGVVREVPLMVSAQQRLYPSFWLELVRVCDDHAPGTAQLHASGVTVGKRAFNTDSDAELIVNYAGGYRHFARIAYRDLATTNPEGLADLVQGNIVLVGSDLPGVTSYLRTPTAPMIPGVEVAANVVDNLVAGKTLSRLAPWLAHLVTLLVALLVGVLVGQRAPVGGLLVAVGIFVAVAALGTALFAVSIYVPLAQPLLVIAITGGFLVSDAAALAERERGRAETRLHSRLQAISGVVRLVSSSLDQEKLLVEILRWTQGEMDAETCSLLLMDEDRKHLRFEVALGEAGPMLQDFRLELGKGIAGTVAQTGEPVIVADVHRDPRWAQDIAQAVDFPTRSIVCVPMMLHDEVTGVIEVINKRGGPFTDHDVQLLTVIAQQAALFVENAKLYRELSDRVDFANVELREANQRLASEMARISTLVDEMGDGVIATDGSDNIVLLNNVAEEMFGLRARGAIGKPVLAVVEHPGLVDLFAMPLSPHGGAYATEITLDEESSRVVRAHIALVKEPGEEMAGKCAVFTDITHLKELDRMKMDLISFVSHELKNPITSLQGVCELMSGRMSQDEERTARLMEIAIRQSGRMQHLVQDFLDLSRIEAGQELELNWSEVADAAELLGSALALAARGGPEHTFETEVAEDTGPFWVDRGKLESVLINLVENAAKYSPEGGRVTLRVFADDGDIVFEVRDEGVGIQEADLPRLFKSFQRVHDGTFGRVSGTGVGLYVCRHIVEAHGGEIEVESTWGAGSTFRLRLPHYTSPPEER